MAPPWSMVDSSSDRRHGDMDDGDDDDTDDDDTDGDTDDDHDDDTDNDNDHKNDSYPAAGAAPGASVLCSLFLKIQVHSKTCKYAFHFMYMIECSIMA